MANDLVTTQRNPIQVMGNYLVQKKAYPGLSEASGNRPRTILIGRMLAGASDSDQLMAHLLCLPRSETFGIAIYGEPAGPTFKMHPAEKKARFDGDDPGAMGEFIDWRLTLSDTTVVASFDPSCAAVLVQTVALLRHDFPDVPFDVTFLAARDENEPALVARLREQVGKVILARAASAWSRFESRDEVAVPVVPKLLLQKYQDCRAPLRTLAASLPPGSQASFASSLRNFARAFEEHLG